MNAGETESSGKGVSSRGAGRRNFTQILFALLVGVVGFAVLSAVTRHSGNAIAGFAAACACLFVGGFGVAAGWPESRWYAGLILNAPSWAIFLGMGGNQFQRNIVGLVAVLAAAYAGAGLGGGIRLRRKRKE